MASENIMMDAVKRGGNRQELHERIRVHSMAAARQREGSEGVPEQPHRPASQQTPCSA